MSNPTNLVAEFDGSLTYTGTSGAGTFVGVDPIAYDDGLVLVSAATNRCTNPSFESGLTIGDGSGLYSHLGGTVQRETGDANATGTYCASIASATNQVGGVMNVADTTLGDSVFSVDYWLASGGDDWYYYLTNTDFSVIFDEGNLPTPTGTTQRLAIAYSAAVNPAIVRLWFLRRSDSAGELRIDAIRLGDDATYFDGSDGDGYGWSGTPHESTSTRAASSASVATAGHIDPASGSLAFRYKRLIDTGGEEIILTSGVVGSGTDYLEIGVDATDHLYMEWDSDNGGANRVTSTGTISVDTEYFLYFEWDGTTIGLSIDNGTVETDTRDAVEGDWGAGDLELVAA